MDRITFHHDTVLSDIHLLLPNTRHLMTRLNNVGQPVFVSKFKILSDAERRDGGDGVRGLKETEKYEDRRKDEDTVTEDAGEGGDGKVEPLLDEDGDLEITHRPRRDSVEISREFVRPIILLQSESVLDYDEDEDDEDEKCSKDVIKIEHTMATPLEDVGKQVWRGAFLMADFILSEPVLFSGATVLELGAGTGVTSIVMGTAAKTVYCTDVGVDLLSMCDKNVALNRHLMEPAGGEVKVRQLDWLQHDLCTDAGEEFSWTEEEVADMFDNTHFIIAADVCYDEDLTDGLFRTLYKLCSSFNHTCTVYISIEKRMNFTLRHLDVSCEAYEHFRRCLSQLQDLQDGRCSFTVTQLQTDFSQFMVYERIEHLELWKVTSSLHQTESKTG
ncbi:methyltransferase-like protein 22 [Notolabrus celidotus]|uniref:methyltransferase-like protein 22 n=1 Tax=Notolabrus celidotus TaxID=1203425 RepID=UPI00148FFE53|nr:methyltransferase-like protein 22 [Notolabrus celidotus]XP_034567994.1 methyltransferase-like protein 22 [Notolabrus celidotus]